MSKERFVGFAWCAVVYNLFVIVWGAFVRATGSGAGCGSHWPLCNGEIVPRGAQIETLIELSHRVTSGVTLILAVLLVFWAFRLYRDSNLVRWGALSVLILTLVEAAIGAGLVLLELVAYNVSIARAYWIAGHLINTFFLLAALTLTAWWASPGRQFYWRGQGAPRIALLVAMSGVLILGASGGITALGDTLVLTAGISPQESAVVAQLVSLRIYHPLIAFAVGGVVLFATWLTMTRRPSPQTRLFGRMTIALFALQLVAGAVNVVLKAPVAMQMLHLLLSDLIWIGLVLQMGTAFSVRPSFHAAHSEPTGELQNLSTKSA